MFNLDILRSWQNLHIDSLTSAVKAIMVKVAKWKPLELPLSAKTVNLKKYCILEKAAKIRATIKAEIYSYLYFLDQKVT